MQVALLELKQLNIPAVPVHDALIIEDRPGVDTEHLACLALTRGYASVANAQAVARVEVRSNPAYTNSSLSSVSQVSTAP